MKYKILPSAVSLLPDETALGRDNLPVRESGNWATEKHRYLTYYSTIFNEAMRRKWASRVYIEFFAGPGKCLIRETNQETDGSVLKILECDFTKFIFIEMCQPLAEALKERLQNHPKKDRIEIWVGDCNEAIDKISLPINSLSLAFIDPTRIGHCPFELIQKTRNKPGRIDLLINIPTGMDIKRNFKNYIDQKGPTSHLSRYLNSEEWRSFPSHNAKEFCRKVIELFEKQLSQLRWGFIGKRQQIVRDDSLPLYDLFFASGHPKGQEFWHKTLKQCNEPELF